VASDGEPINSRSYGTSPIKCDTVSITRDGLPRCAPRDGSAVHGIDVALMPGAAATTIS
jgi:hypothetical protein